MILASKPINFSSKYEHWVRATLSQSLPINRGEKTTYSFQVFQLFRLWQTGCQQACQEYKMCVYIFWYVFRIHL